MLLVQTLLARRELQTTLFCRFEIPQHRCREKLQKQNENAGRGQFESLAPRHEAGIWYKTGTKSHRLATHLASVVFRELFYANCANLRRASRAYITSPIASLAVMEA
jgi:hypothetical protein